MESKTKIDTTKSRFSDAAWFGTPEDIIIGGVGGIGSWTSVFLARVGHNLYLYDMDVVEMVNLAGQLYGENAIGLNKAEACELLIKKLCPSADVNPVTSKYDQNSPASKIMIAAFDNMEGRRLMFENWAKQDDRELFLDGRMLAETGMMYTVVKGQEDQYRNTLFLDSEVEDAACSFKATSHCGGLLGSLLTGAVNNFIANRNTKMDIREVPFKVEFSFPAFTVQSFREDT